MFGVDGENEFDQQAQAQARRARVEHVFAGVGGYTVATPESDDLPLAA